MQKLTSIQSLVSKGLCLTFLLFFASSRGFGQPSNASTVSIKDAKVEERILEAADGSVRVVKMLIAVNGQYLECSGEGPKSLGPLEQFKGAASCPGSPPRGIKPGLFSFDLKVGYGDSLIIYTQPGSQIKGRQIQLKGGGQLNLEGVLMTRVDKEKVILKSS